LSGAAVFDDQNRIRGAAVFDERLQAGSMVNWGVETPLRSDDVSRLERLAARGLSGTLPSLNG
jgi:hypothetical protein